MKKQTKNVITRDSVEKELRFNNKAGFRYTLTMCAAWSLFCVPLTVGVVCNICGSIEAIWLKVILSVFVGALTSAPIWALLLSLKNTLREKKLLKAGDFCISVREVQYKEEKLVNRRVVRVLHFADFGDISTGGTIFELASAGDEFYIIHYKNSKSVQMFYPLRAYELKEK